MVAGSIYRKTCPACAGVLGREVARCSCGHVFVTEDAGIGGQPSDEDAYEAYIAARIEQGLEALELARAALRALPGDYTRALRVMQQVHELQALRLALESQRAGAGPDAGAETRCPVDRGFATPTEAFRAAEAARAEVVARRTAGGRCPACGCPLAAGSTQCACSARTRSDANEASRSIHPDSASTGTGRT